MNENMPCEFCDTSLPQEQKLVTVTCQRGGQWLIFEDVPALVCPNCGHRYFDAAVLEAMEERMKAKPAKSIMLLSMKFSMPQVCLYYTYLFGVPIGLMN